MALYTDYQNQVKNNIESYLNSLDVNFSYLGFSNTNGTSIYYSVSLKGSDIKKKVRFSDHSISNPIRMANEVCFNIHADFSEGTNALLGKLGHRGYSYEPVTFKVAESEVKQLKEGQKAISKRVTKNGNTLYTIEINKPVRWAWVKK